MYMVEWFLLKFIFDECLMALHIREWESIFGRIQIFMALSIQMSILPRNIVGGDRPTLPLSPPLSGEPHEWKQMIFGEKKSLLIHAAASCLEHGVNISHHIHI